MPKTRIAPIEIENCPIMFKNFAGKEKKFNPEGNRNFCAIIEDEKFAERLSADGWNVKCLASHDEDQPPRYYIQVAVAYKYQPPKVYMISGRNRTALDEESIEALDYADIVRNENGDQIADIIIVPYQYELSSGNAGVKAYLKCMYVQIEEDRFAEKYANYGQSPDDDEDTPF